MTTGGRTNKYFHSYQASPTSVINDTAHFPPKNTVSPNYNIYCNGAPVSAMDKSHPTEQVTCSQRNKLFMNDCRTELPSHRILPSYKCIGNSDIAAPIQEQEKCVKTLRTSPTLRICSNHIPAHGIDSKDVSDIVYSANKKLHQRIYMDDNVDKNDDSLEDAFHDEESLDLSISYVSDMKYNEDYLSDEESEDEHIAMQRSKKKVSWGNLNYDTESISTEQSKHLLSPPAKKIIGASLVTGVSALILGGPIVAGVATFGVIYGYNQEGKFGEVCRTVGDVAVSTSEKVAAFEKKHQILDKAKDVALTTANSIVDIVQKSDKDYRVKAISTFQQGMQDIISSMSICTTNALDCVCAKDDETITRGRKTKVKLKNNRFDSRPKTHCHKHRRAN